MDFKRTRSLTQQLQKVYEIPKCHIQRRTLKQKKNILLLKNNDQLQNRKDSIWADPKLTTWDES